jgi:hypothetical protein
MYSTLKIFIVILLQITFSENVFARYIQADPIGINRDYSDPVMQVAMRAGISLNRGSVNGLNHPYTYVNANPVMYTDFFGLTRE